MHACTIIAKNYIAQARVLARSFLEHNPDGRFAVLIIDELDGFIDAANEPFAVLSPHDVGCESFAAMAARYDVLELSTAVKPWLLRHQLRAGAPAITYLDPDIQVFASLQPLDRLAREHGLVLTPHNTAPIPHDGERPSQVDIMIAGVYNLGYISLSASAEIDGLLDWWSERLRQDCRVDPRHGYFVDQRWFDLAPGFVSRYAIVREPEYNVAYWNIHGRRLERSGAGYTVDGRPLGFFHFSGFDPAKPAILSRHQSRIRLDDDPPLAQLCAGYARAVHEAGYAATHAWPYTYGRLADGTPVTRLLRGLIAQAQDERAISESPFERAGCEAFLAWAGADQDARRPGVSRALAVAHDSRPDLRVAFRKLSYGDAGGLRRWAAAHGDELGLPERLLHGPAEPRVAPERRVPVRSRAGGSCLGVNVVGYFVSEAGTGEAARRVVSALDAAGVPLLPLHGETIPVSRQQYPFAYLHHSKARYPVNLICMNADVLPEFAERAGSSFFAARHSIGLWFWEVTSPPPGAWASAFEPLDEVWVPTEHVVEAVRAVSPLPVVKITIPIELPLLPLLSRRELGVPDGFMFLFSFDYLSVFARKNPLAVVDAFARTFAPGSGATLVLKCINHERDPANHRRLLEAVASHPDIELIDRYLTPAGNYALTAACDCYVSLHRSEGFGLTMAEAMYLGKPVVATGYSGNLDFMTPENSYLVDHHVVPIGPGAPPYPPSAEWAQPDIEHAARLMREVFDAPERAAARGALAAAEIRRTHAPAAAGAQMARRLDAIRALADLEPPADVVPRSLRAQVDGGPLRSSHGPLRRVVRRSALRVMKPFTAYQRSVNDGLLRSLEAVGEAVMPLRDAELRIEAAMLAERRRLDRLEANIDVLERRRELQALTDSVGELGFVHK